MMSSKFQATRRIATVAVLGAALAGCGASTRADRGAERPGQPQRGGLYMVDMLQLNDGVEVSAAQEYFDTIGPIIARHGLQSVYRFQVHTKMAGSVEPQIVNFWKMRGPNTMPGIQGDPQYQANVPTRNATFDMSKMQMFMVEATMEPEPTDAPLLFVDLLDLQAGVEPSQAAEYFSKVEPVVEGHGLVPVGRFRVTKKMAGTLEPELINLWTMSGPDTMPAIQGDPAYKANVPLRNSTFDMSSASMFMLTPVDAGAQP